MITKKFISNDEKIIIETHFFSFNLWITENDIATFFKTDITDIQEKIKKLEKKKYSKRQLRFKNSDKESIIRDCYEFSIIKDLNKHYKSFYYKEFRKWSWFILLHNIKNWGMMKKTIMVVKSSNAVSYLSFVLWAVIFSAGYLLINVTSFNIENISLSLFAINIAVIGLSIPTLININNVHHSEIKLHIKSKNSIDKLYVEFLDKTLKIISNKFKISILITIICSLIILITNLSIEYKNALAILSFCLCIFLMKNMLSIFLSGQHLKISNLKPKNYSDIKKIEKDVNDLYK